MIAAMEMTFRTELENEREKHMEDLETIGKQVADIGIEEVDRRLQAVEHGLGRLLSILNNYAMNPSAVIREGMRLRDELNTLANPAAVPADTVPGLAAVQPPAVEAPSPDAVVSTTTPEAPAVVPVDVPPVPSSEPVTDAPTAPVDAPSVDAPPVEVPPVEVPAATPTTFTGEDTPAWTPPVLPGNAPVATPPDSTT